MDDFKPLTKGAILRVSGKVLKLIKRDGQCKLMIQSAAPVMTIFADFALSDPGAVAARKIRKGSEVSLRGKVTSFGSSAVCLSDCFLT